MWSTFSPLSSSTVKPRYQLCEVIGLKKFDYSTGHAYLTIWGAEGSMPYIRECLLAARSWRQGFFKFSITGAYSASFIGPGKSAWGFVYAFDVCSASSGRDHNQGTKPFCISGQVNNPCVAEEETNIPLKGLIENTLELSAMAGTTCSGSFLAGALSRHPCGPNTKRFYFDALKDAQSSLGTGAVIATDKSTDIVATIAQSPQFYKHESCGQCTLPRGHHVDHEHNEALRRKPWALQNSRRLYGPSRSALRSSVREVVFFGANGRLARGADPTLTIPENLV
ncbi:hypothetical protein BJY52DRAFT_1356300 [Lactarius psammicola]|nr:hypothetical protein BJY52DRAFT_1356300 [Lactarius psammicola]